MSSILYSKVRRALFLMLVMVATLLAAAPPSRAEGPDAVISSNDCLVNNLPANDDGSSTLVDLPGTTFNFLGQSFNSLYVNNNGNVTFDQPLATFTPFPLLNTNRKIIAPFFADVDTRSSGSDVLRYGFGTTLFNGRPAFCANWVNVGYFNVHSELLNSFQLLLVDRSDTGPGNFDIVFNYDKVQWETGEASGGVGGLGGSSARAGYSNGTDAAQELPGSAVNGAFLDGNAATGLIHNSANTFQLGRYIFPVRNGGAGTSTVTGIVSGGTSGNPLAGASVQVCPVTPGTCAVTSTNSEGRYSAIGLLAGDYVVTAFPPAGSNNTDASAPVDGLAAGETREVDLVLPGPQPLPPGTTITNRGSNGGVPVVYWNDPLELQTTGCAGGNATWEVRQGGAVIPGYSGAMTEGPPGTYSATIPPLFPNHGTAEVVIHLTCPVDPPSTIEFNIYIDPSGVVRDTGGTGIGGATVTLLRGDASSGPFTPVPDGSAVMSPANRSNPDLTLADGQFGWDVIAGFYKVRAEAPGCHAPGAAGQAFVETGVLTIPPPVTDLALVLECETSPTTTTTSTAPSTTTTTTTTVPPSTTTTTTTTTTVPPSTTTTTTVPPSTTTTTTTVPTTTTTTTVPRTTTTLGPITGVICGLLARLRSIPFVGGLFSPLLVLFRCPG